VEAPLRVEDLSQADQIALVGAAPMMEEEQALGIPCGGPLVVFEAHRPEDRAPGRRPVDRD
jgi:hypothetical protein